MHDRILESLLRLLGRLPWRLAGRLGALAGRLLYARGGREVRNARVNLELCFPELDEAGREALVRRNMIETGRSLTEMLRIWVGPRLDLDKLIDDNGFEAAARALLARGNGLILAMPHIGNWELLGDLFVRITPCTALFRPPRMRALDGIMREGRSRTGVTPVPIDRSGLKALHASLQRGEGVVILPDQVPKSAGASGVIAPFFGHPAMTMTLIGRLARRHAAPVLFCCVIPDEAGGRHQLYHFDGEPAIADADPEISAAALNRGVERCARAFPAHYQWTYRRFEIPGRKNESPYRR
jgi:KDO2-lipid IV(A) lauroyltransferase